MPEAETAVVVFVVFAKTGDVPLTETVCVYTAVPEQVLLSNRLKTTDPETLPEAKTIFALSFGPRRGGQQHRGAGGAEGSDPAGDKYVFGQLRGRPVELRLLQPGAVELRPAWRQHPSRHLGPAEGAAAEGLARPQPGDPIYRKSGGHVVIYAGGGKVIAAPHTGTVVQYQPLSNFPPSGWEVRSISR